jgi:hypothetical protein
LYRFSFRKQLGCKSLSFTYSLDLDRGRFDDLFDPSYSRCELRIPSGTERLSLASALSKEIGTGKRARENTNASNESDERDEHSDVTRPHLVLLRLVGSDPYAVRNQPLASCSTANVEGLVDVSNAYHRA